MPAADMSFERAAAYYDATRGLPDDVRARLADVLADELAGCRLTLEVGVGTGRIALPLHDRGVPLVGTDPAASMLDRLAVNAGGAAPFPLLIADATRLPFAAGSYDAVLFSHVLHLITDWRAAVDEAMRVLRPGGVILVDFGGGLKAPWSDWSEDVFRSYGIEQRRPGVSKPDDVAAHLGTTAEPLPPVPMTVTRALAEDLRGWEEQLYSWTWLYPAELMRAACADIRAAAADRGWSLDLRTETPHALQWWRFRA